MKSAIEFVWNMPGWYIVLPVGIIILAIIIIFAVAAIKYHRFAKRVDKDMAADRQAMQDSHQRFVRMRGWFDDKA